MNTIHFFHKFKFMRQLAKAIGSKIDIKQKFYGGYIFLNAVEHSWAWTGERNYTNFDSGLQQFIYKQSKSYQYFIDIGSNIGVMTIGTLLNNNQIKTVSIEPNDQAISLLKKSLTYNKLDARSKVIHAVVSDKDGSLKFDSTGSVIGHVADDGKEVQAISLSTILNEYSDYKSLVKIDIEGYETIAMNALRNVNNLHNFAFIIELHEQGFNNVSDPAYVFEILKKFNGKIIDTNGNNVTAIDPKNMHQLLVTF
jgi:FkbM family methyltransferase